MRQFISIVCLGMNSMACGTAPAIITAKQRGVSSFIIHSRGIAAATATAINGSSSSVICSDNRHATTARRNQPPCPDRHWATFPTIRFTLPTWLKGRCYYAAEGWT